MQHEKKKKPETNKLISRATVAYAAQVWFLHGVSADKSALMSRRVNLQGHVSFLLFHIVEKFCLNKITLKL